MHGDEIMRMIHIWSIANFYAQHGVESIYIFNMVHDILVKVKLEVTGTSIVLNVFGSKQSSDVTRFIFCPNLQVDYFHTWPWLDEPFLESMSLVQPSNPRNGNFDCQ